MRAGQKHVLTASRKPRRGHTRTSWHVKLAGWHRRHVAASASVRQPTRAAACSAATPRGVRHASVAWSRRILQG
eukprot:1741918-Pleurochrysis_carterae.AAC.3